METKALKQLKITEYGLESDRVLTLSQHQS